MKIVSFQSIVRIIKPIKIYNLYYFRPVQGFSLDSRSIQRGEAFIALEGKHKDGHDFIPEAVKRGASLIIATKFINSEIKVPLFIVEDSYLALKKIISFLRRKYRKATVIAITGSLGKTTTKEILSFLLEPYRRVLKNKGTENNILGVAKTIFAYRGQDLIIFELGTNQKGELSSLAEIIKPDIGIITCIYPAHLKGLGDIRQVAQEKLSIFKNNCKTKAILNADTPLLKEARLKDEVYWFGKSKKNNIYYRLLRRRNNKAYFKILGCYSLVLPIYLEYYIGNYLAALLAAGILGVPYPEAVARLELFKDFPRMRMEKKEIGNYLIFNDAYNASPGSFEAALASLKHFNLPKVVVAADMLELGSCSESYHRKLAGHIKKSGCYLCLTYGREMKITYQHLRDLNFNNVFHFLSHRDIAIFLKKKLKQKKHLIFLKGSRSMELEKILKFL